MLVREVHGRVHFALHFLPVHKNGIAVVGDLRERQNLEMRQQENTGHKEQRKFVNCDLLGHQDNQKNMTRTKGNL